jgi:hypothetical protein
MKFNLFLLLWENKNGLEPRLFFSMGETSPSMIMQQSGGV